MNAAAKQLQEAIREAMGSSSRDLSEREALQIGLEVAHEWQMRLDELGDEDED